MAPRYNMIARKSESQIEILEIYSSAIKQLTCVTIIAQLLFQLGFSIGKQLVIPPQLTQFWAMSQIQSQNYKHQYANFTQTYSLKCVTLIGGLFSVNFLAMYTKLVLVCYTTCNNHKNASSLFTFSFFISCRLGCNLSPMSVQHFSKTSDVKGINGFFQGIGLVENSSANSAKLMTLPYWPRTSPEELQELVNHVESAAREWRVD